MSLLPLAGLAFALAGLPAVQAAFRAANFDRWALTPRVAIWTVGVVALVIAVEVTPAWVPLMGLSHFSVWTLPLGLGAGMAIVLAFPLLRHVQRFIRAPALQETEAFRALIALSMWSRLFIVVTASVVEEVLYRGYAIGVGARAVAGEWPAAVLSVAAFTVAHFRWGLAHLVSVLWAATGLSTLFVFSHDLYACIVAHFVVDAVGILLMPEVMARLKQD